MVWRFLRLCGAPPAAADELTQETFVRLWQRPPADRGEAALQGWLRVTARNLFRDSRRRVRGELPFDEHEVEAAWGIVTPINEIWQAWDREHEQGTAVCPYEAGTWGPEAAENLIEHDGRRWRRL